MLLQFQCQNHRSILNNVVFSMLSSSDTSHEDKLIKKLGSNNYISRCASLYGANGSGKTSLLNAMYTMKQYVLDSNNYQSEKQIIRAPHKMARKEPTVFCINFERNGLVYCYKYSYLDDKVVNEELSFWPNGKRANIFVRTDEIISNEPYFKFFGDFKKIGDNCKGRVKPFKLLLPIAFSESNNSIIENAFNFFNDDLILLFPNELNNWLQYSIDSLEKDESLRKDFLNFLHTIGSDVLDLKVNSHLRQLDSEELGLFPLEIRKNLIGQEVRINTLSLVYKNFEISFNDESDGIKRLFSIICPLVDIIKNNKVFICDELETSLHSKIVLEIIRRFINNTTTTSQIIFSTHDTELLDLDLLRRDQIWFTELEPTNRTTDLYSLSDIRNVRKDESIKRGYIAGKYGAIPMINTEIQKIFEK